MASRISGPMQRRKPPRWFLPVIISGITLDFGIWVIVAYHYNLLDIQLAVTLVIVEVLIAVILSALIPHLLEQRRQLTIEDTIEQRKELKTSLKKHYGDIIKRMDEWDYWPNESGEMIRLRPKAIVAGELPIGNDVPEYVEKDKAHLKEYEEAWSFYSKGHSIHSDFNVKLQDSVSSTRSVLEKEIDDKRNKLPQLEY